MEVTERMDDSARDHECANERVPVCERGKEKMETRRSLDSVDALFGAVSLGKSSQAIIRKFELAVLDLKKKHRLERHRSARERRYTSP